MGKFHDLVEAKCRASAFDRVCGSKHIVNGFVIPLFFTLQRKFQQAAFHCGKPLHAFLKESALEPCQVELIVHGYKLLNNALISTLRSLLANEVNSQAEYLSNCEILRRTHRVIGFIVPDL
jgi:hypothetical protein